MEQVFIVMNPLSGEVFGRSSDKVSAEEMAKEYGYGVEVLAYSGAGGKPKIQDGGFSMEVLAERTRILGRMAALGIGGLVYQGIEQGLSPEQAKQLFRGKSESELFGPMGRPAAGAAQDSFFMLEWASAAVQAEFGGRLESFLAYKRAEAKGLISISGDKGRW